MVLAEPSFRAANRCRNLVLLYEMLGSRGTIIGLLLAVVEETIVLLREAGGSLGIIESLLPNATGVGATGVGASCGTIIGFLKPFVSHEKE